MRLTKSNRQWSLVNSNNSVCYRTYSRMYISFHDMIAKIHVICLNILYKFYYLHYAVNSIK